MRSTTVIIFYFLVLFCIPLSSYPQTVKGHPGFEKGRKLNIRMELKTSVAQQAGGNVIDISADAVALHSYDVINTSADNTTLHHRVQQIAFDFEGMGQKRSFDSGNEKDRADIFGEPMKNILSKQFEMTIDGNGKVLSSKQEKSAPPKTEDRLNVILNMIKDVSAIAYPPQKGDDSFFKILPAGETAIGQSWTDSLSNESGKFKTTYTLSAITDSVIVIDFQTIATTHAKAVMMGRETTTTMNSSGIGTILLDKATGIMREKKLVTEANGTTEAMGGTLPVTAKTTITIHVKPE